MSAARWACRGAPTRSLSPSPSMSPVVPWDICRPPGAAISCAGLKPLTVLVLATSRYEERGKRLLHNPLQHREICESSMHGVVWSNAHGVCVRRLHVGVFAPGRKAVTATERQIRC
jgi:hypothetical protein